MSRIPHCLDSTLTDGGKVVSPTQRRGEGNILAPTGTRTTGPSVLQSIASRYTDRATAAPRVFPESHLEGAEIRAHMTSDLPPYRHPVY
jgi:hypothetical protein